LLVVGDESRRVQTLCMTSLAPPMRLGRNSFSVDDKIQTTYEVSNRLSLRFRAKSGH
jgi:hypothetical protein